MAKRASIVLEHTNKTSWLAALSMIAAVCVLPMCLVKVFQPKAITILTANHAESMGQASPILAKAPITSSPPLKPHPIPVTSPVSQGAKPPAHPASLSRVQTIITQKGDTLGKIFKRLGLSARNLQEVIHLPPQSRLLTHIKPGQSLIVTIKNHRVETLVFPYSSFETLTVSDMANHHYQGKVESAPSTTRRQSIAATIRGSLYTTARKKQIPYHLIQQMTTILNREVDFKKGIRTGDHFDILFEARYIDDKQINTGEILAVRYTNKGITHEAVRYTNQDGSTNYYTPQGLSLKKAYDRYPVRFSHIASPFSLSRLHPILHYRRPHYGIDLAAPIGTPIHAIGDGRIDKINWEKGYGNMIKINHNSMYSTIYGHLLRFEKGLFKGKTVHRGQVIGYVGQSGLASGPHCHFEFHKYQQPINPTTIHLPHAEPVPHREMAKFKNTAKQFLAQLKPSHEKA